MQLENYDEADGRRVRLTAAERDRLLGVYNSRSETRKFVGLALMGHCGCRIQEAVDARPVDVIKGDETNQWFLRIPEGKGDKERQTPIPAELAGKISAMTSDMEPDESILGVTTRTLRRWVDRAAEERAAEEDDQRWLYLGPHDLRRTWGHLMLEDEVLPSVLMQFGGWNDYETFQQHYLSKHSEKVQAREAAKVSWM